MLLSVMGWHEDSNFADELSRAAVYAAEGGAPVDLRIVAAPSLWRLPTVLVNPADMGKLTMVGGQPCRVRMSTSDISFAAKVWPSDALSPGSCVAPAWLQRSGSRGDKKLLLEPAVIGGIAEDIGRVEAPSSGGGMALPLPRWRCPDAGPPVAMPGCAVLAVTPDGRRVLARLPDKRSDARGRSSPRKGSTSASLTPVQAQLLARSRVGDDTPAPAAVGAALQPADSGAKPGDAAAAVSLARSIAARASVEGRAAIERGESPAAVRAPSAAALRVLADKAGMPLRWLSLRGCLKAHLGGTGAAVGAAFRAAERCADGHNSGRGAILAVRAADFPAAAAACLRAGAARGRRPHSLLQRRLVAALEAQSAACARVHLVVVPEEGRDPESADGCGGSPTASAQRQRLRPALLASVSASAAVRPSDSVPAMSPETAPVAPAEHASGPVTDGSMSGVVGQREAKAALQDAIWLASRPMGTGRSTGVLLYGPPGCSKTMLARAVAGAAGLSFLVASSSSLLGRFVGDAERAVAALFRRARKEAPAVVFLDEVDAIAAAREEGSGTSSRKRLLNQLLQEMQGVAASGAPVVVIGATNRPDRVDTALSRAGRLDQQVFVGPPSAADGAAIVARLLAKVPGAGDAIAPAIERAVLARVHECRLEGALFSGADFAAVARHAAHAAAAAAVRSGSTCPTLTDAMVAGAFAAVQPSLTRRTVDFYQRYRHERSAMA